MLTTSGLLVATESLTVVAGTQMTFFIGATDISNSSFIGSQTFTGIFDSGNTNVAMGSTSSHLGLIADPESGEMMWDTGAAVFT